MEHAETLKTVLQDIINDRKEQATVLLHDYFVEKVREVSEVNNDLESLPEDDDDEDDYGDDEDDE